MVAPVATKTLADIQQFVFRQFGDEAGVQIDTDDIVRWTNQGQMEIINKIPMLETEADSSTVVGQQAYTLPANIIRILAIQYDTFMLTPVNFAEAGDILGKAGTTADRGDCQWWWSIGNSIYLYPIPQAVKALKIFYSNTPVQVASLSDLLGLPDRYYDRLCEYVMSKAYELDQDWQAHSVQRAQFEGKLKEDMTSDKEISGAFQVISEYGYY